MFKIIEHKRSGCSRITENVTKGIFLHSQADNGCVECVRDDFIMSTVIEVQGGNIQ